MNTGSPRISKLYIDRPLVDGDELYWGSDPTERNADGDRRDDFQEIVAGLDPNVADYLVNVTYVKMNFGDDGDTGTGEVFFNLGYSKPQPGRPNNETVTLINQGDFPARGCHIEPSGQQACEGYQETLTVLNRSATFVVQATEWFSIFGNVGECDDGCSGGARVSYGVDQNGTVQTVAPNTRPGQSARIEGSTLGTIRGDDMTFYMDSGGVQLGLWTKDEVDEDLP